MRLVDIETAESLLRSHRRRSSYCRLHYVQFGPDLVRIQTGPRRTIIAAHVITAEEPQSGFVPMSDEQRIAWWEEFDAGKLDTARRQPGLVSFTVPWLPGAVGHFRMSVMAETEERIWFTTEAPGRVVWAGWDGLGAIFAGDPRLMPDGFLEA